MEPDYRDIRLNRNAAQSLFVTFVSDDFINLSPVRNVRAPARVARSPLVSLNDVADGSVMVFIVDSSRLSRGAFLLERTITCHVEPVDYRGSTSAPIFPAGLIEDGRSLNALAAKITRKEKEKSTFIRVSLRGTKVLCNSR